MQFWNELEGQILDGYPLRRLVRSEGRTAWFETESHEGGVRAATISLTESLTDAEEVTERLLAARRIQHPDLAAISKVGQKRLDGTLFVYAVLEHSEQNLSDVLRERALSPAEATQVVEAMVGALTEIHRLGLAHGRVEPASILAVGNAVKLRSDCLQSPGSSRAGDIAGIGATLFEAFSQRKAPLADDAQINRIPAPFAEIVRNSLNSRWDLAQIAAALRPSPAPVRNVAATSSTEWKPSAPPAKSSAVGAGPIRPPQPLPKEKDEDAENHSRPASLYIALAAVILLFFGWLFFRPKTHPPASAAHTLAASNPVSASIPSSSAGHAKTSAARIAPTQPPSADGTTAGGARSIWRVVAYTYRHQDQAQHKAEEVNGGHSALKASVFSPKRDGGPYLVILGGSMDRAHAFAMRDRARSMGLPPDTYAQNFSR